MKIPFIDLKAQHGALTAEILPMIIEALEGANFIGGPNVEGFEKSFAAYCGTRFCVGVNSGTDALRFALMATGIGPGDAVATVPNTFIATTEAISQVGAVPVFVDVDPHTLNMDPEKLKLFIENGNPKPQTQNQKSKIQNRLRAILPVHLYGQPVDMDPILEVAREKNLIVIEDACQAHGALYKDRKAGSIGTAGCFSFYPGKNLGACGEGGAVVTDNEDIYQKIRMIRDHGQEKKYFHMIEGYNGRLDAIQTGVLLIKLQHLAKWNVARRTNAALYDENLSEVSQVTRVSVALFAQSVYHLYVILVENRNELQEFLQGKGIATGLHYPLPLHLQQAYAHLGYNKGDFPIAESAAERLISLPIYPELTKEQIEYVCACIREFLKR